MQPGPNQAPSMQDSVVGGNVHTGNIVHNHYHAAPQPVVQQTHTVVQQTHTPAWETVHKEVNVTEAYLLWFFLGIIGGHRFYLGQVGMGILYLCTFGVFFIGWIIDAFLIPDLVMQANNPNQVGQHPYR